MSSMMDQHADAAAGALQALSSVKKRELDESPYGIPPNKLLKTDFPPQTAAASYPSTSGHAPVTPALENKTALARKIRLEQNRKAARESRRRKKVMIEELQRSVIFFSRANGTLKQQNEELMRLLVKAQAEIAQIEERKVTPLAPAATPVVNTPAAPAPATPQEQPMINTAPQSDFGQAEADAVAAQAEFETKGFPSSAARAAAHSVSSPSTASVAAVPAIAAAAAASSSLPTMEPGATMQAMANFQQAAALAMQMAMKGMTKNVPGVNVNQLAAAAQPAAAGQSAQQAFTDTMTALAMQQAAAAAAAGQMMQQQSQLPFLFPMFAAWSNNAANGDNSGNNN